MASALRRAQQQQNMSASALREFKRSSAFAEWRRQRDSQRYRGYADTVVDRAISVANGTATASQAKKVNSYLSRAKASYTQDGAGSTKLGGVARNVVALRAWGYDPYGTFSSPDA